MTTYPYRVGVATDRWLNAVVWAGRIDQAVSEHAALDAQAGKRLGCIVCRILGALVQRRHCALTLNPDAVETPGAAARAGLLMLGFFSVCWRVIRWL